MRKARLDYVKDDMKSFALNCKDTQEDDWSENQVANWLIVNLENGH